MSRASRLTMVGLRVTCCSLSWRTIRSFMSFELHSRFAGGDLRHKDRVNASDWRGVPAQCGRNGLFAASAAGHNDAYGPCSLVAGAGPEEKHEAPDHHRNARA